MSLSKPSEEMGCGSTSRLHRPFELPGLVEESLRFDIEKEVAIVVARLGGVHDRPAGKLGRLHVVVGLIVEREAAVDHDVLLRVQRIREDEDGGMILRVGLAAS